MKIDKIDHIGIAVKSLKETIKFYEALGLKPTGLAEVPEQKVLVAFFFPTGNSEIELLESTTPDGPVARFIENKGEGIQHIALRVENIDKALSDLKAKGVRLIDETPRSVNYVHGDARIAFVHPKSTGGVLLELIERK
ncbi:MAG: Ethylmalonyl-CoA/methylmalonyl-CoA epimerase [Syntrophus sp. SKADARSKE-3]|nr:Ethylmalonyl-CoA/methylmalonyl-CoA epimerase [Syntrophus sp. SKADARSKE-3]